MMPKYIDADSLYRRVKEKTNPYGKPSLDFESGCKVLDMIEAEPTIDAVGVVRCKDCRYFAGKQDIPCERCLDDKPTEPCGICSYTGGCVEEDGYCYRAWKKDGDGK